MPKKGITDMAALMREAAEAMAAGTALAQAAGLAVLKAEMEALSHVLPGGVTDSIGADDEAQRLADEAAREEGFDNMPV